MHSTRSRSSRGNWRCFKRVEMLTNEPPGDRTPSPATAWRRRRDRLAALESSINAQERDERQRAVRALLRQPLLAPEGPTREAFTLVHERKSFPCRALGSKEGLSKEGSDCPLAFIALLGVDARLKRSQSVASAPPCGRRRWCPISWGLIRQHLNSFETTPIPSARSRARTVHGKSLLRNPVRAEYR